MDEAFQMLETNMQNFAREMVDSIESNKPEVSGCYATIILLHQHHKCMVGLLTTQAKAIEQLSKQVDELTETIKCMPPSQGPDYQMAANRRIKDMGK